MVQIKSITLILTAYSIMCGTTGYADDGRELQSKEKYFIDMPDEDVTGDVGGICDPNKANPCESSSRFCVWVPEEMQYMCRTRGDVSKRDANYKRLEKARKLRKNKKEKSKEEVEREHMLRVHPAPSVDDRDHEVGRNSHQGRNFVSADTEIYVVHYEPHSSNQKARLGNARQNPGSKKGNKTRAVPKYEGLLKSDGKSDATCILKHIIAENLQEARSMEDKEAWIENYKEQICDFNSFFHCTRELPDYEDKQDVAQFNNPDTREGVCRCFESSMVVIDNVCYIPVGFGVKSTCGDNVHIPYPIKPWKGAPPLKPKCTPYSECREGPYWFGKRCECGLTSTYNKLTHTCDTASITNIPHLMLLIMIPYISHLFFAHE